ncbi:ATP-binding cassette domain-containing protein [Candidatus Formimonas warabiya]|uniref:Phosphonate C-P lyase system protein PhnK n=1 Tax=Formimonas warabiya TaxID=1761012 RepID=A0A3G1KW09_FORW1|nr:ATP-binding cassette domain-containing protein [Candidatus Formimonas warabiya]ATW26636.1 phosphonate C-P lyase system protein PhnK [Candidatus Formimonas warabiya]
MKEMEQPVLSVRNLHKQYGSGCAACRDARRERLLKNYCPACGTVYACQDISFEVFGGEILGVVGESGSGKSTLMKCLYFDQEVSAGEAYLYAYQEGRQNIFAQSAQQKRYIQNHLMGKVYQNPLDGLRMNFSSLGNIGEKLIAAGHRHVGRMEARGRELLAHVNIPEYRVKEAPKSFSGGMQQRVQIAKALSNHPPLLLLDEVTTGLDLSVQASVLDLIKMIQRDFKISMVIVSHDFGVIRMLADRTMVMLDGRVIEHGLTDQVLEDPQHSYTQQLVQSLL